MRRPATRISHSTVLSEDVNATGRHWSRSGDGAFVVAGSGDADVRTDILGTMISRAHRGPARAWTGRAVSVMGRTVRCSGPMSIAASYGLSSRSSVSSVPGAGRHGGTMGDDAGIRSARASRESSSHDLVLEAQACSHLFVSEARRNSNGILRWTLEFGIGQCMIRVKVSVGVST